MTVFPFRFQPLSWLCVLGLGLGGTHPAQASFPTLTHGLPEPLASTPWTMPLGNDGTIAQASNVQPRSSGSAVSIIYNLRDHVVRLELPETIVAGIFQGDITNWQQVHVRLPNDDIRVVTRSGSGLSNLIFTGYLNQITNGAIVPALEPDWHNFPYAQRELDGEVAAVVDATPGSIGYVSSLVANYYDLPTATIKTRQGDRLNEVLVLPRSLPQP